MPPTVENKLLLTHDGIHFTVQHCYSSETSREQGSMQGMTLSLQHGLLHLFVWRTRRASMGRTSSSLSEEKSSRIIANTACSFQRWMTCPPLSSTALRKVCTSDRNQKESEIMRKWPGMVVARQPRPLSSCTLLKRPVIFCGMQSSNRRVRGAVMTPL